MKTESQLAYFSRQRPSNELCPV